MSLMVRVVKVGGSLFGYQQLPERGEFWLASQSPGVTIFVSGGGELVEPLRAVHERFRLDQEASHWLAVRAMTVTSRLLAQLLNLELVERFEVVDQLVREVRRSPAARPTSCVLDCEEFLQAREPQCAGLRLPRDWSCTSDSIAARLAEVLGADELVLLKSVPLAPGMSFPEAANQGLVDSHFPRAAEKVNQVRWVDFPRSGSDPADP